MSKKEKILGIGTIVDSIIYRNKIELVAQNEFLREFYRGKSSNIKQKKEIVYYKKCDYNVNSELYGLIGISEEIL